MNYLSATIKDASLTLLATTGNTMHLCSAAPTTFLEATTTLNLATKTALAYTAVTGGTGDTRKVSTVAFTDGVNDATGTATHWAIVSGTELLAVGEFLVPQELVFPGSFSMPIVDITLAQTIKL